MGGFTRRLQLGAAGNAGGGGGGGSTAPPKETWQPVQIPATGAGTQVGPNGQYSLNKMALSSLTVHTGDVTLNTPNQVFTGVDYHGIVTNNTSGCIFYSCRFRGSQSSANVLVSNFSAGPVTFYDCFFDPTLVNSGTALVGANFTCWRSDVWRTTDGFGPRNPTGQTDANAYMYNNYVHDLCAWLTDPSHKANGVAPGPSHNDCCQFQGGNNCEIIGNTFLGFVDQTFGDGPSWNAGTANTGTSSQNNVREFGPNFQCNSAIQTNQNNGKPISSGVKINDNYFDGGIFTLNLSNLNGGYSQTVIDEITGNFFGHNQGGYPGNNSLSANNGGNTTYADNPAGSQAHVVTWSNNIYADNSVPVQHRANN